MELQAILKAGRRLEAAKNQIARVDASKTFEEFEEAWYFFLVVANNVQTVLEKGAKSSPQSRQWFGNKKKQRKNSLTLQYLFQARNDDEHGLARTMGMMTMTTIPGEAMQLRMSERGYMMQGGSIDHPLAETREFGVLVPVRGRGDEWFRPPTEEELGNPAYENIATTAAAILISHLEGMLEEAAELVT